MLSVVKLSVMAPSPSYVRLILSEFACQQFIEAYHPTTKKDGEVITKTLGDNIVQQSGVSMCKRQLRKCVWEGKGEREWLCERKGERLSVWERKGKRLSVWERNGGEWERARVRTRKWKRKCMWLSETHTRIQEKEKIIVCVCVWMRERGSDSQKALD